MKKLLIISLITVLSLSIFEQNAKSQTDSIPQLYVGIGTGLNSFTGLLGVSGAFQVHNKLYIRGGVGFAAWGTKYSIGIKYDKSYVSGWSYCLSYSLNPGLKDFKTNLELKSGTKKDVTLDYLSASTINFALAKSWRIGKKNNFYLEFGYAVPMQSEPWKIKDGSELSSTSKTALNLVTPGGIIFGLGFNFGI